MKKVRGLNPSKWRTLGHQVIISDRWLHLRADKCQMGNGKILDPYYVIEEPDWVHVAAFSKEYRLLLVRQYRYAVGVSCWELPGGAVHKGEKHLTAAKREMLEETGAVSVRWSALGKFYANPARQNNLIHGYLADGVKIAKVPMLDATEEIESRFFTVNEVMQLIDRGKFPNVMHVALLYLALDGLGL